jgi:hypothetical protein
LGKNIADYSRKINVNFQGDELNEKIVNRSESYFSVFGDE